LNEYLPLFNRTGNAFLAMWTIAMNMAKHNLICRVRL